MTNLPLLLDSAGDALEPDGYVAVNTEADLLRHVLSAVPLVVQGNTLCRWAEEFCIGRCLAHARIKSPQASLQAACPALTKNQAEQVVQLLGAKFRDLPPYPKAADVLVALYPDGPWQEMPSRDHAARWLLWLDGQLLLLDIQPLLAQLAQLWSERCSAQEESFFMITDASSARQCLAQWMGITGPPAGADVSQDLGLFPLPVPSRWQAQARQIWSQENLSTRADLLNRARKRHAPDALLEVAAELSHSYFMHHPEQLMPDTLCHLEGYLSTQNFADLQALCPPGDPGPFPDTVPAVLRWFTAGYLPYRQWEVTHGDAAAHARAEDLAKQFAFWCLGFYPTALAGGHGQSHLAIQQAKYLRQSRRDVVTLWVIFDGLTYADGERIAARLSQHPRLSQKAAFPVFSSLPTITSFCKRALINGVAPALVFDEEAVPNWAGARMLERNKSPQTLLEGSTSGDVFIWSLTEPDKTYHARFDVPTVKRNVQSELDNWVQKIIEASLSVPDAQVLRIIISTDHGRMLAAGRRRVAIPDNMEAHGRAAYGDANKEFEATGVFFEDDIVYLERNRFQLAMDCAVALGPDVFETNDGKTGVELFPHGGLYPEEVLIPWLEFARDQKLPLVRCNLFGQGRAGASALLGCRFENFATTSVSAAAVRLDLGDGDVRVLSLNLPLQALEEVTHQTILQPWPTNLQIERATATVEYETPNGSRFQSDAFCNLVSQEMQRRDISLGDL